MKIVTITAVLGALVAIPFIFGRKETQVVPATIGAQHSYGSERETNLRYDVDDFLTEA